jgi:hypothetical protein
MNPSIDFFFKPAPDSMAEYFPAFISVIGPALVFDDAFSQV